MAHIPKRATQHGVFLPGHETARPCLKPGQDQLCRQNYYTTEAKDLEETYLADNAFQDSVYRKDIARATMPEDYEEPVKPMIPPNPKNEAGYTGSAHWRSEYSCTYSPETIEGAEHHRQFGPPFESTNPPSVVSMPNELSMYQKDFGQYGSNPRQKLDASELKLPNPKSELTIGTTKGTSHIPGYQGFLPTNTNNPLVASIESGERIRTVDKSNLTEIYHLNIPDYAGHVPGNAKNDRGPRQINSVSVMGKDFSGNAGLAK